MLPAALVGKLQVEAVCSNPLQEWQKRFVITRHIALPLVHTVAAVQVDFRVEPFEDPVDIANRLGDLALRVPPLAQTIIVRFSFGHQPTVTEIGEGRVIELDDVNPCFLQCPGLSRQNFGEMIHEMLQRRVDLGREAFVPVANSH